MDLDGLDRVISAMELAESGYKRAGNFMVRREGDRMYRFIEVAKGAFTYDGVHKVGSDVDIDDSEIKLKILEDFM